MFFGGMFCAYLIYRSGTYNEFAAGSRSSTSRLGTINTAVLICSSLTVALAVRAAQMGKRKLLVIYLAADPGARSGVLGIKGVEWTSKFKEHHIPGSSFHFEADGSAASRTADRPAARADFFFPLFRHDRHARPAHDHWSGNLHVT